MNVLDRDFWAIIHNTCPGFAKNDTEIHPNFTALKNRLTHDQKKENNQVAWCKTVKIRKNKSTIDHRPLTIDPIHPSFSS